MSSQKEKRWRRFCGSKSFSDQKLPRWESPSGPANPPSVDIVKDATTMKVPVTLSCVQNSIKIAVMFLRGWVVLHNAKTPNKASCMSTRIIMQWALEILRHASRQAFFSSSSFSCSQAESTPAPAPQPVGQVRERFMEIINWINTSPK